MFLKCKSTALVEQRGYLCEPLDDLVVAVFCHIHATFEFILASQQHYTIFIPVIFAIYLMASDKGRRAVCAEPHVCQPELVPTALYVMRRHFQYLLKLAVTMPRVNNDLIHRLSPLTKQIL